MLMNSYDFMKSFKPHEIIQSFSKRPHNLIQIHIDLNLYPWLLILGVR
jgi:hypothetical protein